MRASKVTLHTTKRPIRYAPCGGRVDGATVKSQLHWHAQVVLAGVDGGRSDISSGRQIELLVIAHGRDANAAFGNARGRRQPVDDGGYGLPSVGINRVDLDADRL